MNHKTQYSGIALLAIGLTGIAQSQSLAECRDQQLANLSATEIRNALHAAGGRNCEVRSAGWGESVACQGTLPGTRVYGLPVRELSAEVQRASGQRTLAIVTDHPAASVAPDDAADGLKLRREQDARGVTVISCVAQGPASSGDAALATTDVEDAGAETP